MPHKLKQCLHIKQQKDLLAVLVYSIRSYSNCRPHMCVQTVILATRVCAKLDLTCVCASRVLDVQAVHGINWFSYSHTGVHHACVYLLYSYCRLACACTILRVCLYIALRVAVHCFACVQKTAREKISTY